MLELYAALMIFSTRVVCVPLLMVMVLVVLVSAMVVSVQVACLPLITAAEIRWAEELS